MGFQKGNHIFSYSINSFLSITSQCILYSCCSDVIKSRIFYRYHFKKDDEFNVKIIKCDLFKLNRSKLNAFYIWIFSAAVMDLTLLCTILVLVPSLVTGRAMEKQIGSYSYSAAPTYYAEDPKYYSKPSYYTTTAAPVYYKEDPKYYSDPTYYTTTTAPYYTTKYPAPAYY